MSQRSRVAAALLVSAALGVPGLAWSGLAAQQPGGTVPPAKRAAIVRLLELTGAAQLSIQAMETSVPAQRAANPMIPGVFWDAFLARARRDVGQLIDSMVPIYDAHFTQAQLEELARFYETPLGRHLSRVQSPIAQASMLVGQRWGEMMGQQVAESLMAAGVRFPD